MILIGYSGHGLVAAGILSLMGRPVSAYCDKEEKNENPLNIPYLGSEKDPSVSVAINSGDFFISIGNNRIRKEIGRSFEIQGKYPVSIIHPSAVIAESAQVSAHGVMISANVCINPFAKIGEGAILNTSSVIEHECVIGSFAHIGPGAILCGNVIIGEGSFIGAGAVIRQNLTIGRNATVGAGSVVIRDVSDDVCVVGNPSKILKK